MKGDNGITSDQLWGSKGFRSTLNDGWTSLMRRFLLICDLKRNLYGGRALKTGQICGSRAGH